MDLQGGALIDKKNLLWSLITSPGVTVINQKALICSSLDLQGESIAEKNFKTRIT